MSGRALPSPKVPGKPAGKLAGVDALRGLAAILVVAVHVSHTLAGPKDFGRAPFAGLFTFGHAGVDFFFVLSGFVITYVHFDDIGRREAFGGFWYKRLLRIYPTYWAAMLLYGALLALSPTPDRAERDLVHAVSSFFLLPEVAQPILGVGWSLRHELVFYALFSVALLQRSLGLALLGGWGLAIGFSIAVLCATGTPYFGSVVGALVFHGYNAEFFLGIATAILLRRGVAWRPGAVALTGATGFLAAGLWESFGTVPMQEWSVRNLGYALSAALVLYGVATLDAGQRSRVPGIGRRLGAASYSIYLTHIPTVLLVEFALRFVTRVVPVPVDLAFFLVAAAGVVAGTVFSEWVEQPILRWGRRRAIRVRASTAANPA